MKKSLFRRVQFFSNIAIILIAILLGAIVVLQYIVPKSNANPTPTVTQNAQSQANSSLNLVGKTIPLQEVDWGKSKKNLILYVSNTCHFCSESADFYKKVVTESSKNNTNLVAVLPQTVEEGREYLKKLEVNIDNVYQSSPDSIGLRGTPTLLLVNEKGIITDVWMGKLQPEREEQVLTKLKA